MNNCATAGLDADVVNAADVTATGGPDGYAALYTVDYLGQLTNLTERRPNAAGAAATLTSIVSRPTTGAVHEVTGIDRKNNGTTVGTQAFVYDSSGRQTKRTLPIKTHTLGDTTHGVISTITYDGNGRWLSTKDQATGDITPGTRTTGYIYDPSGALLARHDDDAGDDLAATGVRPGGQRTLWLGTGGSAGIGATGMSGTGGLQIQLSRKPGATATTAGTTSAVDPTQQLLTVSRSIVAPVLADGAPIQIATHTASALLSTSTASGVVTQAATPALGRVWFTVGDAHASLGGAGTPGITVAGNAPSTDAASPYSQSVTVAGSAIAAWAGGNNGASAAGTAGVRRTTPYGAERTALATTAPTSSNVGATAAANSKTNTPGGLGGLGFLNAGETAAGGEDGPVLPGATTISGSGYATTGLVQLGARGYDPAFGLFTAPDPISSPFNPSDAGSFTYAHSRVGLATDPTGLSAAHNDSGTKSSSADDDGAAPTPNPSPQVPPLANVTCYGDCRDGLNTLADFTGITDAVDCYRGSWGACAWTAVAVVPLAKPAKLGKLAAGAVAGGRFVDEVAAVGAWLLAPMARGKDVERAIVSAHFPDARLQGDFKTFDVWLAGAGEGGLAISIKSIDLGAKSYRSAAALERKLKRYVDIMGEFDEDRLPTSMQSRLLRNADIGQRNLLIAYDPRKFTTESAEVFNRVAQYASQQEFSTSVTWVAVRG